MFAQDGEAAIQLQALQDTKFLVLTGEPLNEPIQGYGPFVMNSKAEIVQAFDDFNRGKFGEIPVAVVD
jgi:redox-sensitive bicupin YhaK (pirin superfamily)